MTPLRSAAVAMAIAAVLSSGLSGIGAAAADEVRGTGDLGIVVERAAGSVLVIDTSERRVLGRVEGLGDLSHASAVFSRDQRYAYVFGRDGGLTKVDLLARRIAGRVVQAGNSIGGAISGDGRVVAVANYEPGGVRLFDSATLAPLAEIPATVWGERSKVVGLEDAPGRRFTFSLFEAGEIWLAEIDRANRVLVRRYENAGRQPYDALVTPDGRYYIAGLFGEDGLSVLDLWKPEAGVRKVLEGYGRGEEALPVFKMPHLESWSIAGQLALMPAIGRHEALLVELGTWREVGRVALAGQPVFVVASPDGRTAWVNFALSHNDTVQVIDLLTRSVVRTLKPGKAILHLEFSPRGEEVWLSARDDNRVVIYDTQTYEPLGEIAARDPSGIFFSARAQRIGM